MTASDTRESGQAAPIYITMVAGLLFLALAFFAVGQAGATHNGAQSAADAAALAAAQESRDQFREDLLGGLLNPGFLDDIFNGNPLGTFDGCQAAERFADRNGADLKPPNECVWASGGRWGFTVRVITQKPMGESILPGTADQKAEASATAVVEPRCSFEPAEEEPESPGDGESPEGGDVPEGEDEPVSPGELRCDGGLNWLIDPENLDLLPDMADLFSVRLAQD
ncbi:pilus assembly protein TadG-related protein [Streptomyces odonnellii]|uniref:pilus assembly protein TadG-related protein n=1 Tax=Streptomyces odonnellii TaxID=1417980 RepID=UPI0007C6D04D|nr:pilus assembly protein TadG-related protein [Streptomyces odonnellii]